MSRVFLAICLWLAATTSVTVAAGPSASSCSVAITTATGELLTSARVELRAPDGSFHEIAPSAEGRVGLAVSAGTPASVRVRAPGFAERRFENITTCPRALTLRPAMTVSGLVRAPGGEPIGDAVVSIDVSRLRPRNLPVDADNDGALRDGKVEVRTQADGRFALGEVPRASGYELQVKHAGQAPLSLVLGESAKNLELRFVAAGSVTATVIGDDRNPVANVQATARSMQAPDLEEPLASSSTGADGVVKLGGLAPGSYRVEVLPPAGQRMIFDAVVVAAGATKSLGMLKSVAGVAIEGEVLDANSNAVAKAKVRAYRKVGDSTTLERSTLSGTDGKFRLSGLRQARYQLQVTPPAPYLKATKENVEPGQAPVEIEVERGGSIAGAATSASGTPLGSLDVLALEDTDQQWRQQTVKGKVVDPRTGAFTIEPLPKGSWIVRAWAPGHAVKASEPIELVEAERLDNIALVLEAGLTLRGSVVDQATKAGIPGATVWEVDRPANSVVTARDGSFALDGLTPGTVHLNGQHPDFAATRASSVVSAEGANELVIELSRGAALEGSVRNPSGAGVAGVQVRVTNEQAQQRETTLTGADGSYRFAHLAAGQSIVKRSDRSGAESVDRKTVTLVDGETARVDFVAGVSVYGTVARGGVPFAGVRIAIASAPMKADLDVGLPYRLVSGWTGPDGSYRLEGLDSGTAKVRLEVDRQTSERLFSIPEGSDYRFDIPFPSRLVTGTLRDKSSKRPIVGSVSSFGPHSDLNYAYKTSMSNESGLGELQMSAIGGSNQDETSTDDAGRFAIAVDRDRDLQLSVRVDGYKAFSRDLKAGDPDQDLIFELENEKKSQVIVKLVGPNGTPANGGWSRAVLTFASTEEDMPSFLTMSTQFSGSQDRVCDWVEGASIEVVARASGLTAESRTLAGIEPNSEGNYVVEFQLEPAAVLRANMLGVAAGELVAVKGSDGINYAENSEVTGGVRPFEESTRKGVIVDGLPAGEFVVEIKGSDGVVRSYPVRLEAGKTTELEVR